jgi:hypothetical protein
LRELVVPEGRSVRKREARARLEINFRNRLPDLVDTRNR